MRSRCGDDPARRYPTPAEVAVLAPRSHGLPVPTRAPRTSFVVTFRSAPACHYRVSLPEAVTTERNDRAERRPDPDTSRKRGEGSVASARSPSSTRGGGLTMLIEDAVEASLKGKRLPRKRPSGS